MSLVVYEKKGRIAYITLNRPDQLNALNPQLVDELEDIWIDFRDDDRLFVAVLSAAGKAFCTGADVKVTQEEWRAFVGKPRVPSDFPVVWGHRIDPTMCEVWKPVVAALNGYVLGGGLWLALGCDIRIAAEDAQLGLPEIKVGLPAMATTFLSGFTFLGAVSELLLLGDSIDAQRAYQIGLVNKVVPREQLMPSAMAVAERLARQSPLAVRALKELLYRDREVRQYRLTSLAGRIYAPVVRSEDLKEGWKSFTEKRQPQWKGK